MNMDHFADLKKEMEDLKKKMQERGQEIFREGSKIIFEQYPDLEWFSWRQYTPYWNDGEPCEFSVWDELNIRFKNAPVLDEEEAEEYYDESDRPTLEYYGGGEYLRKYALEHEGVTEDHLDAADAAVNLVRAIPEEVMYDLFGDHATVTIFADHVEVDEYSHD